MCTWCRGDQRPSLNCWHVITHTPAVDIHGCRRNEKGMHQLQQLASFSGETAWTGEQTIGLRLLLEVVRYIHGDDFQLSLLFPHWEYTSLILPDISHKPWTSMLPFCVASACPLPVTWMINVKQSMWDRPYSSLSDSWRPAVLSLLSLFTYAAVFLEVSLCSFLYYAFLMPRPFDDRWWSLLWYPADLANEVPIPPWIGATGKRKVVSFLIVFWLVLIFEFN